MRHLRHLIWPLTALLAAACGSAPSAPVADEAPPAVAVAPAFKADAVDVLGTLGASPRVIASKPGGTIAFRAFETGETVQLDDFEQVTVHEVLASEGFGRAEARITARGLEGSVDNVHLATADRVLRQGQVATVSSRGDCTSACTYHVTAFFSDAARAVAAKDLPTAVTSLSRDPRKTKLAVGGGGLRVVTVATGYIASWAELTAPTYGRYGVLFARGVGESDAVSKMDEWGRPNEVLAAEGTPDKRDGAWVDPKPVTIDASSGVVTATFMRNGVEVAQTYEP